MTLNIFRLLYDDNVNLVCITQSNLPHYLDSKYYFRMLRFRSGHGSALADEQARVVEFSAFADGYGCSTSLFSVHVARRCGRRYGRSQAHVNRNKSLAVRLGSVACSYRLEWVDFSAADPGGSIFYRDRFCVQCANLFLGNHRYCFEAGTIFGRYSWRSADEFGKHLGPSHWWGFAFGDRTLHVVFNKFGLLSSGGCGRTCVAPSLLQIAAGKVCSVIDRGDSLCSIHSRCPGCPRAEPPIRDLYLGNPRFTPDRRIKEASFQPGRARIGIHQHGNRCLTVRGSCVAFWPGKTFTQFAYGGRKHAVVRCVRCDGPSAGAIVVVRGLRFRRNCVDARSFRAVGRRTTFDA